MGALARPTVADGPVQVLFDALHDLHHRSGWPSLRDLAREVGCSRTTVSAAFSQPRVPRWGLVELLVEALGGDTDTFHRLWLTATAPGGPVPPREECASVRPADRGDIPQPRQQPHQLPPDVAGFTGRRDDLDLLDAVLTGRARPAPTMAVAVISGTAGVGKTALAVHWAHRVAAAFPDGQLYLDLRGYDPDQPLTSTEALGQALRGMGDTSTSIPAGVAERAARFRSLLSDRRVLLLLDNARSVDQVRDLLPGSPSCLVLVTSRETMPALVARYGATRLNLDLLSAAESVELLTTLVDARVRDDPANGLALARRCAHLPLALRLAAEMCAARPDDALGDLVAELDDQPGRLDLLDAGDDHTAVRSVFSWSYRNLPPPVAATFQLLGLHPGVDIGESAAAALLGAEPARARRLLDALARAHLVERRAGGRYAMHDLLRAYAAELAAELPASARQLALSQLLEHYGTGAATAVQLITSSGSHGVAPTTRAPAPDPSQWLGWLDVERANIVAAASGAAQIDGLSAYPIALAETLAPYLDVGAHYGEALALYGVARAAAIARRDRLGEAMSLNLLGTVRRRLGDYALALDHHRRALEIDLAVGHRRGEGRSRHNIGIVLWRSGRYREARDALHAALDIHRDSGDRAAEGAALYSLGIVYRRLGRYQAALDWHQQALDVLREIGDRAGEGRALSNAGVVFIRLGRYEEASTYIAQALEVQREKRDRVAQAVALTNLGLSCEGQGRCAEALDHLDEALALSRETGYRAGECDALRGLGVVASRLGQHDRAVDQLGRALALAVALGEAEGETGALNELGGALTAAGRAAEAAPLHARALELAAASGDPFEQARALDGLAQTLQQGGDWAAADEARIAGRALLLDLGLPALVPA